MMSFSPAVISTQIGSEVDKTNGMLSNFSPVDIFLKLLKRKNHSSPLDQGAVSFVNCLNAKWTDLWQMCSMLFGTECWRHIFHDFILYQ